MATKERPSLRRLQKLFSYLRPHWRYTTLGILALLVVNALGVYLPRLVGEAIDDLSVTFSFDQILRPVILILVLATVMWAIRLISRILLFGTGRQVEFDLKQKIFERLLTLEPAYFTTNTAGDLINRATSDVDNIRRLVGFAVLSLANTVFAYALTLPVMLSIDVGLTCAAVAIYPVILLLVQVFSDRLRSEQLVVQQELSEVSELVQEDMSGISLIKIYAQEDNERRAFRQLNQRLLAANLTLAKTRNILFPLLGGLASISLLVLLWFGSRAIADGAITVGDFIELILYVERLIFPTALLGFTITAYQRGEVSIDRVESIFTIQPHIRDEPDAITLPVEQVQGQITARNLTFTYPGSTHPALEAVNFTIQPGEMVAVVGPVGSGKSTLANALPHLLKIQPSQLFLDGQDITHIRLQDLRAAIAYVPQDSFLFSTTLKNNIRYGNPLSEQPEIEQAAKQAQIHNEVLNFPQQYETIVGERGITLSGGQRQRTALGRALLIDAPVLILDDALSSVDNQTATNILNALSNRQVYQHVESSRQAAPTNGQVSHGQALHGQVKSSGQAAPFMSASAETNLPPQRKTVLFISHQLSAAATADRILVMDRGQIVQSGTHGELIEQPGLYQSLWNQHRLEEILK